MTKIIPFKEDCDALPYYSDSLTGYIFEDVFDIKFVNALQKFVKNILAQSNKNTFYTHNTSFNHEGKNLLIGSHKQNDREQNVVYDLTLTKDYYFQTVDTIKNWSRDTIKHSVSPIFIKCLEKIESLPPVCEHVDDYVLYRCHINYLAHNKWLGLHYDGNPTITSTYSNYEARMYSFTFYLEDHKEGLGGEFWSNNGFVYKPKKNSAIIINGNKVLHGVTQNIDIEPRLAFTVRIIHKDDLYLPGSPDKWLWDMSAVN
jgi:hypothetical protein